jgi:hypothetical protein
MRSQVTLQDIAETIDRSTLDEPSDGLRNFLASLPPVRKVSDRRRSERYSVIADVVVVPLDKDFRPAARPFIACSLKSLDSLAAAGTHSWSSRHRMPS